MTSGQATTHLGMYPSKYLIGLVKQTTPGIQNTLSFNICFNHINSGMIPMFWFMSVGENAKIADLQAHLYSNRERVARLMFVT